MNAGHARKLPSWVTLQILLWRHGWAWPIALAVLLMGLGLQEAVLLPAQTVTTTLQTEAVRLARRQPAEAAIRAAGTARDEMHSVLRAAPGPAEIAGTLLALAESEGIALPRGDYQQRAHPLLPVVQLRITQPVRTSYPQLRRYIEAVLRTVPSASLDQVSAQRNNVAEGELEVRLHWSVWRTGAHPLGASTSTSTARSGT